MSAFIHSFSISRQHARGALGPSFFAAFLGIVHRNLDWFPVDFSGGFDYHDLGVQNSSVILFARFPLGSSGGRR
jgi:hypothetical protein